MYVCVCMCIFVILRLNWYMISFPKFVDIFFMNYVFCYVYVSLFVLTSMDVCCVYLCLCLCVFLCLCIIGDFIYRNAEVIHQSELHRPESSLCHGWAVCQDSRFPLRFRLKARP